MGAREVAPVGEAELPARGIRTISQPGASNRLNLRDAGNTTLEPLFDPLLQRHHGDGAIFTRTKEAKLDHTALLIEAYELDIPAIRFERGTYRLQNLFDLRLDGILHENVWVMHRFECLKNLGNFRARVNGTAIY